MSILSIVYVPLLAVMWTLVVLGVRWTRTGRRPVRFMRANMRGRSYCVPISAMAGMETWLFVNVPRAPWHHAVTDRLLASGWTWWGSFVAAMAVPAIGVLFLTRAR